MNISEMRLNSIEEVVARMRLSRSKVYEEIEAGRLQSVKVGRRRFIAESALVDYINNLVTAGGPSGGCRANDIVITKIKEPHQMIVVLAGKAM